MHTLENKIFTTQNPNDLEKLVLKIFDFQFHQIPIYHDYCVLLGKNPTNVSCINEIPFLPIQFFKSHEVRIKGAQKNTIFTSSGTTGIHSSKHYVPKLAIYEKSFVQSFAHFFPDYQDCVIIGLLPAYMERQGSSLVYMVDYLVKNSRFPQSTMGITLTPDMKSVLQDPSLKTILIGVTFALLNLADTGLKVSATKIIETGGMKGMRKELVREDLHEQLQLGFGVDQIYSEYGMTELLSQAYYTQNHFKSLPFMQFRVRDMNDPLSCYTQGKGVLNVIDLANLYSCAFIATDDLVEVYHPNAMQVLGRVDHSQLRGCNLLFN